ncbi:phosphotransferase [Natronosporangium hydrolyticum]|uniref:Phosphotransferase n=1 Tax=Natronosporangium hydrolyticum TaxID=2811111 RepID=A0A895YI26_9ACTN|nr:phosphotransferase [Natronosporangium hydrolyticum]QSB13398.1 phosphotransferase [Natronosporangium hydrolyticum]
MPVTAAPQAPGQPWRELLTGPDAGDILQTALVGVGGHLLSWRAHQVEHRRNGSTAAYRVQVRWPTGEETEERFGAWAGAGPPPPDTLVIGDGTDRVAVWRFPHDPYLPGLATAYDPAAVAGLLRSFDLARAGDEPPRLRVRAYRPHRRAVIEAIGATGHRLFLKVVPPAQAATLHRQHTRFTDAGVPVPPSLGHSADGVVALAALPGHSLRQELRAEAAELPTGAAILALLDRLPAGLADAPVRRSWRDRAGHYATAVASVLPREAERVRELAAAIYAEGGTGPIVPVHGDFYENQVWVAGGRITGLLDLDTAGAGDRLDDLACLLGHLSVLTQLNPAQAATVSRAGARYLAAFEQRVDPADLRYRVAAVVLSLATGPYRVQESGWQRSTRYRVELAERWLTSARAVRRG